MISPQKSHTRAAAECLPTSIGTASSFPGSAPLILPMKFSRRSPPMKPRTTSSERTTLGSLSQSSGAQWWISTRCISWGVGYASVVRNSGLDEAPHDLEQFAGVEGFGEVVGHAMSHPAIDVRLLCLGREEDNRDRGRLLVCLERLDRLIAVHAGHHDVQDDQGRSFLGSHVVGLLAVVSEKDLIALELEVDLQQAQDHRVVVANEDPLGGHVRVEPSLSQLTIGDFSHPNFRKARITYAVKSVAWALSLIHI